MGHLTIYREDLFKTDRRIIGHGVNCSGAFAAGIAGQVAKRFPEVKRQYLRKKDATGWNPGDVQFVLTASGRIVVNMATQKTYGRAGTHVLYHAVRDCLGQLLDFCVAERQGVAIPRVGCGLGGGKWEVVEGILRELLETRDVEVDVYAL